MGNRDIDVALSYHNGTKHPGGNLMNPHHVYDPMHNPLPFKIYEDIDPVPLPLDTQPTSANALSAIANSVAITSDEQVPDLATIARILKFSAGITKTIKHPWGEMSFRSAACTGALYHIEIYLVCGDLPGLLPALRGEAGVFLREANAFLTNDDAVEGAPVADLDHFA